MLPIPKSIVKFNDNFTNYSLLFVFLDLLKHFLKLFKVKLIISMFLKKNDYLGKNTPDILKISNYKNEENKVFSQQN